MIEKYQADLKETSIKAMESFTGVKRARESDASYEPVKVQAATETVAGYRS